MIKEKSCGIVLFKKNNNSLSFLLLHYQSGHWDFSKGHTESGEDEKTTAIRELEEETGIKNITFIDGFRESIQYFFKRNDKTVAKEVVFYLAEAKSGEVKISYEHVDYKWLDFEKTLELLTFKNSQEILKKALEFLSKHP